MTYYCIVLLLYGITLLAARQYPLARVVVPIANVVKEPGVTFTCSAPVLGRDVQQLSGQVIYNELVRVMKKCDSWYYVQVPHLTYILDTVQYCVEGWIQKNQVHEESIQQKAVVSVIVCTMPWTAIYQRSVDNLSYTHLFAVPCGTKLENIGREGFWYKVRLFDGREAYVPTSAVRPYTKAGPCSSDTLRDEIVRCARTFLGSPYCFVGCSAYDPRTHNELTGFDCSGLVFRLHDMYGIEVPRNSASQYAVARMISPADMRAGDLVFLARKEGSNMPAIYHVMIYSGEGTLIEATARRPDNTIDPQPLREIPVSIRLGNELSALQQGAQYREDFIYCASLLPE